MNSEQRGRIQLREYARYRVRSATRWVAIASSVLAAAFAVVLAHHGATAVPGSTGTPAVDPRRDAPTNTGQHTVVPLQPPAQPPSAGFGGGFSFGSSGGS